MVLELQKPRPIWQIMFSTHHTDIGLLYLILSIAFLFLGGALALAIRVELFLPGTDFIADSMTFNRIFTVHGTTLIFLFIIPFASAVGNYFVPIMVRYKDMAYPKLNAIAFWMIPPAAAPVWLFSRSNTCIRFIPGNNMNSNVFMFFRQARIFSDFITIKRKLTNTMMNVKTTTMKT